MTYLICPDPHCRSVGDKRRVTRKGLCQNCYRRRERNGTTQVFANPPMSMDVVVANAVQQGACLIWTGGVAKGGYPRYFDGARHVDAENAMINVRRWIVQNVIGFDISNGTIVKSTCDESLCVLPDHLYSGDWSTEHTSARRNKADCCRNGHAYDEENTYINPRTGVRSCRRCTRDSKLRSRGIDPEAIEYQPYRRNDTRCRAGHLYAEVGFKDYGEGRICNECRRIKNAKANLARYDGLTFQDVARMLAEQGGACACCPHRFAGFDEENCRMGDVNVDHCHKAEEETGEIVVRGLLCMACNIILGKADDVPSRLRRLADYVEKLGGETGVAA